MTEITVDQAKILPEAVERFVLHWGDMGGQWGVNRSVAQVHALLYLSARPLAAEDIADQLGLARSNISNSLKELLGWKLIRRIPVAGDRRDHFEAEADLWEMVRCIAAGRKSREIDPAIAALDRCKTAAMADPQVDTVARARLQDMHTFLHQIDRWYSEMLTVPTAKLTGLIRLGARIVRFLT